ncbi:hypothetical protein M569_01360, partial [Genlisea aurea]
MAGSLPGVEAARRRRIHSTNLFSPGTTAGASTRRPSFCLYATSHDFHSISSSRTPMGCHSRLCDESLLNDAAREAKRRLDQKLHSYTYILFVFVISLTSGGDADAASDKAADRNRTEAEKRRGAKMRHSWFRSNWKSSEQADCAVCLEAFATADGGDGDGEAVMQLPCGHRFHGQCLRPWLERNADCPCCRMKLLSKK